MRHLHRFACFLVLAAGVLAAAFLASAPFAVAQDQAQAQAQDLPQDRLALVIGQGTYPNGRLPTTVNDAGLVAQSLTSAGFEVVQGADLNGNDLRRAVRDFLDKAEAAEPDAAIVIYLSGYGVQLEGENYLLPTDARIQRDADVALEGFRLSDLVRSLGGGTAKTRILIADMARDYPLPSTGEPIARGLALMEPPAGFLIAFSSAPNIPVVDGKGPYGAYATALVEMMRQPGLPVDDVFARVRLRTHEATNGAQTPWHASNLTEPFVFFEPADTASAAAPIEQRQIASVPAEEAYSIAVERDSIAAYQEFLRQYPDHPLARRVSATLSARREALVWRRTLNRNSSEAYWTYLRGYPRGPHASDARRRLARLSAPLAPPPVFEEVIYDDLPPPLPMGESVEYVTIIRDAPPPPPPPIYLLPERDYDDDYIVTIVSEPPPPPIMIGVLPVPIPIPIPIRARPPVRFYQPIAPITPRGPMAIPIAMPPRMPAPPPFVPGGPRRPRPPQFAGPQPTLPGQPGVVAPAQPIPIAVNPAVPGRRPGAIPGQVPGSMPGTMPGAVPGAMPGAIPGRLGPRLPSRPIPPVTAAPGQVPTFPQQAPTRFPAPGVQPAQPMPTPLERPRRGPVPEVQPGRPSAAPADLPARVPAPGVQPGRPPVAPVERPRRLPAPDVQPGQAARPVPRVAPAPQGVPFDRAQRYGQPPQAIEAPRAARPAPAAPPVPRAPMPSPRQFEQRMAPPVAQPRPMPMPMPQRAAPMPMPQRAAPMPMPQRAAPMPMPQRAAPMPMPQRAAPVPMPQRAAPVPQRAPQACGQPGLPRCPR